MNWSAILHGKSLVNAIVMFCAGFGAASLVHLPAHVALYVGLGAIIANQLGLHQAPPGA